MGSSIINLLIYRVLDVRVAGEAVGCEGFHAVVKSPGLALGNSFDSSGLLLLSIQWAG